MVKGVTRQVILVKSPDPELFEQAIFIVRADARGVTEEQLLKQARQAARGHTRESQHRKLYCYGPAWACCGAALTGIVWLLTVIF